MICNLITTLVLELIEGQDNAAKQVVGADRRPGSGSDQACDAMRCDTSLKRTIDAQKSSYRSSRRVSRRAKLLILS
jgi:hypothetical protein